MKYGWITTALVMLTPILFFFSLFTSLLPMGEIMWYRVQYKDSFGKPIEGDDILLEAEHLEYAENYAKHRVDGSYGETHMVFYKVTRISRDEAIRMYNGNCIAWSSDPNY